MFLILRQAGSFEGAYWISTAHPISRIPVFFMGVCAGVLCMRIKEQDYEALNCKEIVIFKNASIFVILLEYYKKSHTTVESRRQFDLYYSSNLNITRGKMQKTYSSI